MDQEYKNKILNTDLEKKSTSIEPKPADLSIPVQGNLRAMIENNFSILSAKKLWAKAPIIGLELKKNQKTFEKLWNEQNLQYKMLFVMEQLASKNGKVYAVIENNGGTPIVRIAENGIHTEVGNKLIDVTVFTKISTGARNFIISQHFNGGNIKTSITEDGVDKDGNPEQRDVTIGNFNKDTGMNLEGTSSYEGSMPVILLENINSFEGYGLPDTYNLDEQIDLLQELYDRIRWELATNMSRIYVDDSVARGVSGRADAAYNALVGKGIVVENPGISSKGESRFNYVASNLDIDSLLRPFFKVFDWIFESAGFKRNSDDKGSVQQNDLEIQQVRDSEITNFKMKESTRQIFLTSIIKKMFEMMGNPLKKDPVVEIQYMSVKNETAIIENMKSKLEMGLISTVDAIAKTDNISKENAIKKLKEIDAEKLARLEMFPDEENVETDDTEKVEGNDNETSKTE